MCTSASPGPGVRLNQERAMTPQLRHRLSDESSDSDGVDLAGRNLPLHEKGGTVDAEKPAAAAPDTETETETDPPSSSESNEASVAEEDGPTPSKRRIRFAWDLVEETLSDAQEDDSASDSSSNSDSPRPGEYVSPTLGRWELTEDERSRTWYSESEFLEIKMEIVNEASALAPTVSAISSGGGGAEATAEKRGGRSRKSLLSAKFLRRATTFRLSSSNSGQNPTGGPANEDERSSARGGDSSSKDRRHPQQSVAYPRGLEMIHPPRLLEQNRSRTAVVFAVLREQEAQRREGSSDPWSISYASLKLSRPKVDEAAERGAEDEAAAREAYIDDDVEDGIIAKARKEERPGRTESFFNSKSPAANKRKESAPGQRRSSLLMLGRKSSEDAVKGMTWTKVATMSMTRTTRRRRFQASSAA